MNRSICVALCGAFALCACDKPDDKMQTGPSPAMTGSSHAGAMMGTSAGTQSGMMVPTPAPSMGMGGMAQGANSGMGGGQMAPMASSKPAASAGPAHM
jgi:hypothetical protein